MKGVFAGLAALATLTGSALADLDPIVIKGAKFFFKSNGTQFFIRGIGYQQDAGANGGSSTSTSQQTSYTDPLADTTRCTADIPILKQLNTNAIRVYQVDPTADHTTCMNLLQQNGIYVIMDLGEPLESIQQNNPQWNNALYTRYTSVIDAFAGYSNVIGFFAGNEVTQAVNNTNSLAYLKAAVRDSKTYIKNKGYANKYVGYAAADDSDIRAYEKSYLNCGDSSAAIDFWGYNIYEWCGDSSYTMSGYDQRVAEFSSYSVPSFFAEYGCITPPRNFGEVGALFGSNMTGVFSGGFAYEYFQAQNNYGLVSVSGNSISKLPAYTAYSTQINAVSPTGVNSASYSPSNTAASCPSVSAGVWLAAATPLPPSAVGGNDTCTCMMNSLSCVVKSSVAISQYSTLFNQVCGYGNSCAGIASNGTAGSYGSYSVCSAQQQLSNAFNAYYKSQNSAASACNFGGAAQVVSPSAASSCSAVLASASSAATNTAAASTSSKAAAAGLTIPSFNGDIFKLGFVVSALSLLGASLIAF